MVSHGGAQVLFLIHEDINDKQVGKPGSFFS